ncbi:MAG: hypothetical protein ACOYD0_12495 [Candidatus Nanopelagicales bacterium]
MPDQSTASAAASAGGPRSTDTIAVMTVCTMNICRSPAMQFVLERDTVPLAARYGINMEVSSAGTQAVVGAPSCDISLAMVGQAHRVETARRFTVDGPNRPDLILCAARSHVSAMVGSDPALRSSTFTMRQACRLAHWVVTDGPLEMGVRKLNGDVIDADRTELVTLTPALPADVGQRLTWLITEMDAARGLAPMPPEMPDPHHGDDIPDPHVLGYNLHRMSADLILGAMAIFNQALSRVLSA